MSPRTCIRRVPIHRVRTTVGNLAAAAILAAFCAQPIAAAQPSDSPLEQVLVRGDWNAVAKHAASPASGPRVAGLLQAHAYLALNRNDESVCLFAQAVEVGFAEWDEWTAGFLARHPGHPIAHYLRGDALARQGQWSPAIEQFSAGLRRNGGHPLLLNARGVAYALNGKLGPATVDLDAAAGASGSFADAYASKGMAALLAGESAERAAAQFDKALAVSPRFALALTGRAVSRAALRRDGDAKADAAAAGRAERCVLPIVQEAIARALSRLDAKERTQLATADEGDIGTSLEAKLSAVERGDVGALNGVARILGDRPDLAPQVRDRLDRAAAANPDLGRRIHDKIDAGRDWTSRSGGANSVLNLLKGFSGSLGAEASRSTTSRRETSEFGASASANLSLGEWVGHHEQKTVRDNSGWKAMLPATRANTWPEGRVGGASSNSSRGNWEQGDWPVVAEFGLFYRLAPREAR